MTKILKTTKIYFVESKKCDPWTFLWRESIWGEDVKQVRKCCPFLYKKSPPLNFLKQKL